MTDTVTFTTAIWIQEVQDIVLKKQQDYSPVIQNENITRHQCQIVNKQINTKTT